MVIYLFGQTWLFLASLIKHSRLETSTQQWSLPWKWGVFSRFSDHYYTKHLQNEPHFSDATPLQKPAACLLFILYEKGEDFYILRGFYILWGKKFDLISAVSKNYVAGLFNAQLCVTVNAHCTCSALWYTGETQLQWGFSQYEFEFL